MAGTNTLTGGITINTGARLIASGSNSLNGAANVVTVNNGGVLQIPIPTLSAGTPAPPIWCINNGGNLWFGNRTSPMTSLPTAARSSSAMWLGSGNSTWTGNLSLTANTTLLG